MLFYTSVKIYNISLHIAGSFYRPISAFIGLYQLL